MTEPDDFTDVFQGLKFRFSRNGIFRPAEQSIRKFLNRAARLAVEEAVMAFLIRKRTQTDVSATGMAMDDVQYLEHLDDPVHRYGAHSIALRKDPLLNLVRRYGLLERL